MISCIVWFETLHQPYLGFWLFEWSRCGWNIKKAVEKIPSTNIIQYYLRLHLHRVIGCRRQVAQIRPKTFERKLCLFYLKEQLIKYGSPAFFVISIKPGSHLIVLKSSVHGLSLW